VNVLVATDIAARGLDIAQLPLVINYDFRSLPKITFTGSAHGSGGTQWTSRVTLSRPIRAAARHSAVVASAVEQVAVQGFDATHAGPSIHAPCRTRDRRAVPESTAPRITPRKAGHSRVRRLVYWTDDTAFLSPAATSASSPHRSMSLEVP
jgi:hypothetical protein